MAATYYGATIFTTFLFQCRVERTNLLREFTSGCAYLPLYRISYASLYIYPTYRNIFYLNRAGRTHTAVKLTLGSEAYHVTPLVFPS